MRENEEPSAIWRAEKNLLDLIRTYKKQRKFYKKTAEMEQQLKQQLMQKKLMQISRKKKRKYSFFHLTIRKNSTNYKKNTIHHHIKKSHTHFKMISNHQRTVLKLFMKKEKCMRKSTKKKHWRNPTNSYKFLFKILLPNMSIIHINLLVILSTHVCASMFKTLIS